MRTGDPVAEKTGGQVKRGTMTACRNMRATGGASFIGSHCIRFMPQRHSAMSIVDFDTLAYAGNMVSP